MYVPVAALLLTVTVAGLLPLAIEIFAAALPVLSVTDQLTLEVTSTGGPPETVAEHVYAVVVEPNGAIALLGLMVIAVTLFNTTTTVVVPVVAPDDAEMVAVPEDTPVTNPVELIEAIVSSEEDQKTPEVNVFVLPSSKFPTAVICRVSPCWRFTFCGPTVIEVSWGSWKKPRQPTAPAREKSVVNATSS